MSRFIVLEGIDGAGTTSMASAVAGAIRSAGYRVVETAEPTRERVGAVLRSVINRDEQVSNNAAALLFAADRIYHDETFIAPHLKAGSWVVCDRYLLSSLVYQPLDGCDRRWIYMINRYARRPDLTIVLQCRPDVAAKRITHRKNRDLYEYTDFMVRAAKRYQEATQLVDWPVFDVDANQAREDVLNDVLHYVELQFKISVR